MQRQYSSQELGFTYFSALGKFTQNRRNVAKNNISTTKANFLPNEVVLEVIQ